MKRYEINCHYDMVVTVEVFAENEEQAKEFARERADRMDLQHDGECMGYQACVTDCEDVADKVLRTKEREAVREAVEYEIKYMSEKDWLKQDLANIAYRGDVINWALCATSVPKGTEWTRWLQQMFREIARGERKDTELYNRYARMYARQRFELSYKRVAQSLFAADCEGTDKLRKKQAVVDGLQVLCDKMEEYVCHQDDEDFKGWEPQMVIRYESETGDTENYWNLFVYCTGPNDQDGDDYLSLATAWQHVWTDSDGRDATDDYGTEEHPTRAALVRYLFYGEPQEFDETDETVVWQRMTDVWVD